MNSGLRAFALAAMMAATGLALAAPDKVFVAEEGADKVSILDAASFKKIAAVPVGREPHNVQVSPDGKLAWVTNNGEQTMQGMGKGEGGHAAMKSGGEVWAIDTASYAVAARVPVGKHPAHVVLTPDGRFAYVTNGGENTVSVVDTEARKVVKTIGVGTVPIQVYATPDSKTLFVANQGTRQKPGKTVSVIDLAGGKVASTVQTGPGAHGVVVDREGRYAYVTNIYENSVSVLDVSSAKVVRNVRVGEGPNG